jgi:hypothetical protein
MNKAVLVVLCIFCFLLGVLMNNLLFNHTPKQHIIHQFTNCHITLINGTKYNVPISGEAEMYDIIINRTGKNYADVQCN